ncbi:transcriptional regulator, AlpA family [Mesorhizobium albiziae]|uniref:Transcriptional regulator, AlpA family n=1 Tax=Neomesorhizobium albiziae TaxID=335020 RepID=A0A1I4DTB7_9HYPH|nr:AlpA family phage regulatory protein [Mesorhizobium albiziae]GLS33748.1 hypothetical protein GCM10007937_54600 [Mesorhizobium albiziae]SFK96283.1 transcriptional regulator, AlpA family [Mesorhizobium albiziae]
MNRTAKPLTSNSRYLTDVQVGERFGVCRTTVWRWTRVDPSFPKPVKVSTGATRWRLADIEAFEAAMDGDHAPHAA